MAHELVPYIHSGEVCPDPKQQLQFVTAVLLGFIFARQSDGWFPTTGRQLRLLTKSTQFGQQAQDDLDHQVSVLQSKDRLKLISKIPLPTPTNWLPGTGRIVGLSGIIHQHDGRLYRITSALTATTDTHQQVTLRLRRLAG